MPDSRSNNGTSWTDEIVGEVRRAREELLAASGYDLSRLAERLRKQQDASGRAAVSYPRRKPAKEASA